MCGPPNDDYQPKNNYATQVRLGMLYSYRLHGKPGETEREYYKRKKKESRTSASKKAGTGSNSQ